MECPTWRRRLGNRHRAAGRETEQAGWATAAAAAATAAAVGLGDMSLHRSHHTYTGRPFVGT
eukprot:scaffold115103_cov69-Phaeocystis_antarctica.AAC.5